MGHERILKKRKPPINLDGKNGFYPCRKIGSRQRVIGCHVLTWIFLVTINCNAMNCEFWHFALFLVVKLAIC